MDQSVSGSSVEQFFARRFKDFGQRLGLNIAHCKKLSEFTSCKVGVESNWRADSLLSISTLQVMASSEKGKFASSEAAGHIGRGKQCGARGT
jgi:hypothetical protein